MLIVIDNYDSFTYNLVHYLGELGQDIQVIRNDKASSEEIIAQNPSAIVISPGPCTPNEAGICLDLIKKAGAQIPIFGVCLGMQSIGQAFGGKIINAPELMHGKTSPVIHDGKTIFKDLPSPVTATRYHSLSVERETLPDCLEVTAYTEDDGIMGLSHKELCIHGVQFHPESIKTEYGHAMLRNFLDLVNASQ